MTSGSIFQARSYVCLSTLRADGSPRNWVVCAALEDDHILVPNPVLGCPVRRITRFRWRRP